MAATMARRLDQRRNGQRLEMGGAMLRQRQIDGQSQRWVEGQQLAVATQLEGGEPLWLAVACLTVMDGGVGVMASLRVHRVPAMAGVLGRHAGFGVPPGDLQGRVQRADMDHQHGEQAKPDARCRIGPSFHHCTLRCPKTLLREAGR